MSVTGVVNASHSVRVLNEVIRGKALLAVWERTVGMPVKVTECLDNFDFDGLFARSRVKTILPVMFQGASGQFPDYEIAVVPSTLVWEWADFEREKILRLGRFSNHIRGLRDEFMRASGAQAVDMDVQIIRPSFDTGTRWHRDMDLGGTLAPPRFSAVSVYTAGKKVGGGEFCYMHSNDMNVMRENGLTDFLCRDESKARVMRPGALGFFVRGQKGIVHRFRPVTDGYAIRVTMTPEFLPPS